MTTYSASVTEDLPVDPDELFALLIDVERLPDWNEHNHHVVDSPDALVEGAEWVVETRALGSKWNSRARVLELDRTARRFAHRSASDDGNPSYALWTWHVTATDLGSRIAVRWELHPRPSGASDSSFASATVSCSAKSEHRSAPPPKR